MFHLYFDGQPTHVCIGSFYASTVCWYHRFNGVRFSLKGEVL